MFERQLGTTIRWASLLPPGYRIPTTQSYAAFVGFTPADHLIENLPFGKGTHITEMMADGLTQLGLTVRESWDRFDGPYDPDGPVVFCPHSSRLEKDWAMSNWQALEARVRASGVPVQWQSTGSLDELETQLRSARLVIGSDTGPLHLADYMGIPVFGLYGVTSPDRYGARGNNALHLYDPRGTRHLTVAQVWDAVHTHLASLPSA